MSSSEIADRMDGLRISEPPCGQNSEHAVAEPEIHALLSKLQDMHGSLESDWGGCEPPNVQRGRENGGNWESHRQADGVSRESGEKPNERCVLEDFTQCSKSHLWKLMMSFYDRKGVESWSQGIVPHFITCNAFIGRSYAHVLNGFLRDCMRRKGSMELDPTEPLYIVELGAGSGKFSFFMLKALLEMKVGQSSV